MAGSTTTTREGGIAEMTTGTEDVFQGFGLSPQQRRLWWLTRSAPGTAFAVQIAVRIEGDLDAAGLLAALRGTVQRHEILRTNFRCPPGRAVPLQVIREELAPAVREVDLRELAAPVRQGALEALLAEELRTPFDLAQSSPVRAALVFEPRSHLLALTLPAFCCDRAGALNLMREIALAYGGAPVEEPPAQYADLAEWQNELLRAPETRAGREHWSGQDTAAWLAGALPCELRPDAGAGSSTLSVRRELPPHAAARIEELGGELGLSSDLLLLAGWYLLLGRWGGGGALAVTANGRRYEELEGVIGLFSRALPIVLTLDQDASLRQAAEGLGGAVREALKFQESFDWEQLNGDIETAGRSFLPWAFDCEDEPAGLTAGGARFAVAALHDRIERYDLRLSCTRRAGGITLEVHWNLERFDGADVERLAAQLPVFLERLAAAPDTPAAGISPLSDGERAEVLAALAPASGFDAGDLLVHQLFERQAAAAPDAPALVCEEYRLTYRELSRRSSLLARHLQTLGIGPEVRVAICAERSLEMVVGLLGVLKAGGAYVPLEPGQPRPRMAAMLEEIDPLVVLAQEHLRESLPDGPWQVVGFEDPGGREDPGAPETGVSGANLAYVLFTSGSTGRPKGVAVEHRQVLGYVQAVRRRLDFPPRASFAMVSTFAADLGLTMLYPALCGGGCLHVLTQDRARDPEAFAEYASRHAIDCLKVVPSHLETLLEGALPKRALPRQRLVLGGEAARPELLARIQALAPECRVFNHYGPTETTVGVLVHPFMGSWDPRWGTLPLGRPLDNARVFLLDGEVRPVPFWLPGEVYVGGAAVSRGYLGQPALTAERFVPDPQSGEPGARLYRTGDLARHLPSAGLEFLGRADHQVKIRGFRIELGEIEAQLRCLSGVRGAVVTARRIAGEDRLVAYVVADAANAADVADGRLRAALATSLPDFMVPSAFVTLEGFPLTANGKLDRAALPEPAPEAAAAGSATPRTPAEELVAGIWAEVLGRGQVDVRANFFALGGHSLAATRVVARLRKSAGVELPLKRLFELPTVAELAREVEDALRRGREIEEQPIVATGHTGELPLSFAQQRHWFLHHLEGDSPLYNIRGAVRLEGLLDLVVLRRSVAEILRRHEVLRSSFPYRGGRPVQVIAERMGFELPLLDLSGLTAAEREAHTGALVRQQAETSFDLAVGPLVRLTLLRLAEREHLAVLTLHHIVADGWSIQIFVRELAALYEAFAAGRPSPLPLLPLQYADFSHWQRGLLSGRALELHLDYWRRHLAGAPPLLLLPTDRPRPPVQSLRSRRHPLRMDAALTDGLRALCRTEGATLFQLLLAVFQLQLGWYAGQDDVVVGAPVAGRTRLETEGLIGCFINALALRVRLGGDPEFRQFLERVGEVVWGAYAHQELPFDKLVEELNPERNPSHAPLFQVVFSFSNVPREPLTLPGLALSPVESPSDLEAKYDLILTLTETQGGLAGSMTYAVDLFDTGTIVRMAGHFELLLRAVVADPGARLSELTGILGRAELEARAKRKEALREQRGSGLRKVERRVVRAG
jgi:amino acid adenylation domain-containing protein